MKRPISSGEPKYETAWAIFVIRIVFNQRAIPQHRLSYLPHGDAPNNALVNGMPGKLKLTRFDHFAYFINKGHLDNTLYVLGKSRRRNSPGIAHQP